MDVEMLMSNDHYSYSVSIQKTSCYKKYMQFSNSLDDLDLLLHIDIITGRLCSLS